MKEKQVIYYSDELNDEFSTAKIIPRKIDENYKYIHRNIFWNLGSFLAQNVLSIPLKILYSKIKFRIKYIGKEKIKPYRKKGYFIYGNHTQAFADTFISSNPIYPKRNFFIVNPENVSMRGLHTIVEMLGAIPVPGNKQATKNFLKAIEDKISRGYSVTIFPEAHIWPYYTKIRPFKSVSFKYPIDFDAPSFCMTNTYQSYGKNNNKIQIVTYIDGPFYAENNLTEKEKRENLRNQIYDCMVERSKNSNIDHIEYRKKIIEKSQEDIITV